MAASVTRTLCCSPHHASEAAAMSVPHLRKLKGGMLQFSEILTAVRHALQHCNPGKRQEQLREGVVAQAKSNH